MDERSPGLVGFVDCTSHAVDEPFSVSSRASAPHAPRAHLYRPALAHRHLPLAPGFVTAIRSAIEDNRPLISAFGVQLAASWLCCLYASQPLFTGVGEMLAMLFTAVPVFAAMWLAISLVRRRPQSKPLRGAYSMAWKDVRATWLTARCCLRVWRSASVVQWARPRLESSFSCRRHRSHSAGTTRSTGMSGPPSRSCRGV